MQGSSLVGPGSDRSRGPVWADRVDRAHVTAWRRTVLSGDVHAHPGPLRMAIDAVLMRDTHAAEAAKLLKRNQADPLVCDLWLSARFVHVRVAVRTGYTVLHVLCVYGVPGDPELNAEL